MATTFYVDPSHGSDSNSGLTKDQAWATLDKVNQRKFLAGDQLLFRAGQRSTGRFAPKGSGGAEAPIVASSYGYGAKLTLLKQLSLYCAEALEFTSVPPLRWLLLLSGGGLIVSLLMQRPYRRGVWKPFYWFAFTHLLFFVAALSVGWFGELGPSTAYDPSGPATLLLYVIQVGSVISCTFWIIRMSGIRWFAASLMLMLEVLTLGAMIVSGMAISGSFL